MLYIEYCFSFLYNNVYFIRTKEMVHLLLFLLQMMRPQELLLPSLMLGALVVTIAMAIIVLELIIIKYKKIIVVYRQNNILIENNVNKYQCELLNTAFLFLL